MDEFETRKFFSKRFIVMQGVDEGLIYPCILGREKKGSLDNFKKSGG